MRVPAHWLALSGPVRKPSPGTLPVRADLAHIALAQRHLSAHYVVPLQRRVAGGNVDLLAHPRADAKAVKRLEHDVPVELLERQGDWAWVCEGPEGPSGYVPLAMLATPA